MMKKSESHYLICSAITELVTDNSGVVLVTHSAVMASYTYLSPCLHIYSIMCTEAINDNDDHTEAVETPSFSFPLSP